MLWTIIKDLVSKSPAAHADSLTDAVIARSTSPNAREPDEACEPSEDALAVDTASVDAAYERALTYAKSGRLHRAVKLLEAVRLNRDNADVNNALGNVQRLLGHLEQAAAHYRRALDIDENHLAGLANLGLTLRDLGDPTLALSVLDHAARLAPGHLETLYNQALAWNDLGEFRKAEKLIERVLTIDATFAQAHLQRAFSLLKQRKFCEGWSEYAWRVRIAEVDHWRDYPYPLWRGENLAGKRLLVQAEQGLGDQIMFASCFPQVLGAAQEVVIESDPRLAKLFKRSFPEARVYRHRIEGEPDWPREPAFDYRARCGDLPGALRNHDVDFPHHAGYLVADPARVGTWRRPLEALGPGLKVGISWRGGTPATGRAIRSIELESLVPVLSVPQTHFVSLQYGEVSAEIAAVAARHRVVVHALAFSDGDLDDVAALIAGLDVVITVCTTAAHLCGALGKPAWVMVPAVAEWRYLAAGARMPWYPSVRLFRQERLHRWAEVISEIARELSTLASQNSPLERN
jgi:tetratricopeptide (TPR) repeat protein